MMRADSIVAGILVGGKSRRMGRDKHSLPWDGATMLETIVNTVKQVTPQIVLLGKTDELPPAAGDLLCLPDAYPNAGPMGGLGALLRYTPNAWSLLLSCDIPHVSPVTLSTLTETLRLEEDGQSSRQYRDDVQCVVYADGERFEPTCALYHADCLPHIEKAVADRSYGLHALIRDIPHLCVSASDEISASLRNINTPEDYRSHND